MITGFEVETKPLDSYEEGVLVPVVARGLRAHLGKGMAITGSAICKSLTRLGYKINGARLRKVVNHIRTNGVVPGVIATSNGYYVTDDRDEVFDYVVGLESRASAIMAVSESLKRQFGIR